MRPNPMSSLFYSYRVPNTSFDVDSVCHLLFGRVKRGELDPCLSMLKRPSFVNHFMPLTRWAAMLADMQARTYCVVAQRAVEPHFSQESIDGELYSSSRGQC